MDTLTAPEELTPDRRRAPAGPMLTFLLLVLALGFLAWAVLPLTGLEATSRYFAALVALTQYAVPCGMALTVFLLVLRRWLTTLVVGLATLALAASVVPRAIADSPRPAQGIALRVLSLNTYFGQGDPNRIVDLVRQQRVDVLSLQELTPQLAAELDKAGLARELPNRVFQVTNGAEGSGIASRYSLRQLSLVPPTTLKQPSAAVKLPEGRDVEFVAVHPTYPVGNNTTPTWAREIASLPDPAPDTGKNQVTPRILAGDFNATLDHNSLRALIGRGYADAAAVTGDGLQPTWPGQGDYFPPPVTIDHVLVSGGVGVQEFRVFGVPGTDHRAILAHLVLPS